MSDVTDADRERAASLTGCVLDDATAIPFCATHDEDGNPPWHRCRWAPIAEALADEREKALAPVLAVAEELDGESEEFATYQRRYSEAGDHFGAVVSEREAWTSRQAADRIRRAAGQQ